MEAIVKIMSRTAERMSDDSPHAMELKVCTGEVTGMLEELQRAMKTPDASTRQPRRPRATNQQSLPNVAVQ